MFRTLSRAAIVTAAVVLLLPPSSAQQPGGPDRTIDAPERKTVIDGVLEKVEANYVFPDVGKKMAEAVRARREKKEYDDITRATHLNDIYNRTTGETRQYWSHPSLPGKKLLGKDVYVLTSGRTFSGAEEFAYNLQTQKRATIVGETTGGGAHPTRGFRVTDHFGVGVPFARSINPVTKTSWEGTGVKPDVTVPADQALHTAHLMALKKAAAKYAGDRDRADAIGREIEAVQKELDALKAKSAPAGAQ